MLTKKEGCILYRVLVTGDRNWSEEEGQHVWDKLSKLDKDVGISVLIEGCARGVDSIAEAWANDQMVTNMHFPADWDNPKYRNASGKSFAGNIRNSEMLEFGEPDIVYAFHHDIENSRGTKDMVNKANKAGVEVLFCD